MKETDAAGDWDRINKTIDEINKITAERAAPHVGINAGDISVHSAAHGKQIPASLRTKRYAAKSRIPPSAINQPVEPVGKAEVAEGESQPEKPQTQQTKTMPRYRDDGRVNVVGYTAASIFGAFLLAAGFVADAALKKVEPDASWQGKQQAVFDALTAMPEKTAQCGRTILKTGDPSCVIDLMK